MEEFFKEMTTTSSTTLVPEKKIHTNEELKLMNWRIDQFDG